MIVINLSRATMKELSDGLREAGCRELIVGISPEDGAVTGIMIEHNILLEMRAEDRQ